MATSEDQVIITNQLLKTMMQTMEYFKVLKSMGDDMKTIAEDVRLNKERLEKIEERDRINDLTKIAEEHSKQSREALQIIEQRMNTFEETQKNLTETFTNVERTQNNMNETLNGFKKTQASFQKSLTNIEDNLNVMRDVLNSSRKFEAEDKENATAKPSKLDPKRSSTQVKESTTTAPSPGITQAREQMTFDSVFKGKIIQLSRDLRTATRMRPTEDYGLYGSVVSNSVLEDDQVFEIRIEERIEKFTEHGIGIGVIQEKQNKIKDANYIFLNSNIKGTWSIYSNYNSQSGKSHTYKDGDRITLNGYPLSNNYLPVGTVLGVSRRSDGKVHFFINGVDKGAAFRNVPKDVYAFVDIMHYVTKISIVN